MLALVELCWQYRCADTLERKNRAATEIVMSVNSRLEGFILRQCFYNPHDAEDVSQEVFLELFRKPDSLSGGNDDEIWKKCFGVAKKVILRHRRRKGRIKNIEQAFIKEMLARSAQKNPLSDRECALMEELEKLKKSDPWCHSALIMHYESGFKFNEIGLPPGVSGAAARKRLERKMSEIELRLRKASAKHEKTK